MIIYCNGDSFTSGHGLGDFLLPGYPGETDDAPDKLPHIGKWAANTYSASYTHRSELSKEIQAEESNRCWPTKLKKYGYGVINSAQAGSSMQRISRTTITDLIKFKQVTTDILAIISVPPIERSEIYYKNAWVDVSHAHLESFDYIPHLENFYSELLLDDTEGYANLVHWYTAAIQIKDHCKANDIPLLWINSVNSVGTMYKFKDVNNLVKYLDIKYELTMAHLKSDLGYVPDGHFSERVHEKVAQILNDKIKRM
jgi:hypothetical protein